jgi:hypothetical protein
MRAVVFPRTEIAGVFSPTRREHRRAANIELGILDVDDFVNNGFACVVHKKLQGDFDTAKYSSFLGRHNNSQ